jgi:hypothetical protein
MTTQEIGFSALEAATPSIRPLAIRVLARTISIIAGIARVIAAEVVYMIREDLSHGRMRREPEDWER